MSAVRQVGSVRVETSATVQAPKAASSAASTVLSDWPATSTTGRNASNGATSTSMQTPAHATVATVARLSAFERVSSARAEEPARGAATRDIGLWAKASKNLATGFAPQGTAGA